MEPIPYPMQINLPLILSYLSGHHLPPFEGANRTSNFVDVERAHDTRICGVEALGTGDGEVIISMLGWPHQVDNKCRFGFKCGFKCTMFNLKGQPLLLTFPSIGNFQFFCCTIKALEKCPSTPQDNQEQHHVISLCGKQIAPRPHL